MKPDLVALGTVLRTRRQSLTLTLEQLAERWGWVQGRISLLESGKYRMPTVSGPARIALALQRPLAELPRAAGFHDVDAVSLTTAEGDGSGDDP